jgi:Bacterial SH3 domain
VKGCLRTIARTLGASLVVSLFAPVGFAQEAVVVRDVHLRSEPTAASSSVRLLKPTERVTLITAATSGGYYHVKTQDGSEGWVWSRNVRLGSVTPATPSASAIAVPHRQQGRAGPAAIYPDLSKTSGAPNPDVTQDNIAQNICNKDWSTSSVRPSTTVTQRIKAQAMTAYGFTDPTRYELDHLISLQVGGCPDCAANLWPEAYGDVDHPLNQVERAKWNRENPDSSEVLPGALEKDKVENHNPDEICFAIPDAKMSSLKKKFPPTVSITLQRGQQILATDWYACYLNMMQGNKPCE